MEIYTFDAVFITFLAKIKKIYHAARKIFFSEFFLDYRHEGRIEGHSLSWSQSFIKVFILFSKFWPSSKRFINSIQVSFQTRFYQRCFILYFLSFFRQNHYRIFKSNLSFRFCQNKFVSRFETGKKLSSFISSTSFLTRRDKFPSILCVVNNQAIHQSSSSLRRKQIIKPKNKNRK